MFSALTTVDLAVSFTVFNAALGPSLPPFRSPQPVPPCSDDLISLMSHVFNRQSHFRQTLLLEARSRREPLCFLPEQSALVYLQCHRLTLSSVPRDALPCTCFIICDAFSVVEALGTVSRSQMAFAHGSHHLQFPADAVPPFAAFPWRRSVRLKGISASLPAACLEFPDISRKESLRGLGFHPPWPRLQLLCSPSSPSAGRPC